MNIAEEAANFCSENQCDFYLYSGEMSRHGYKQVSKALASKGESDRCAYLVLSTAGGDPDATFRIARAFKHHYSRFIVIVPTYCKSAGTLLCVGADELVVTDNGELGPLDIQINKPEELFEMSSGLNIQQAISYLQHFSISTFEMIMIDLKNEGLSTKIATDVASVLTAGLYSPIYSQIDPVRAGEVQRAMQIALEYGNRLNEKSKSIKGNGLTKLVTGYPSHSFVIDRKEASTIFENVRNINEKEKILIDELYPILDNAFADRPPAFFDLSTHEKEEEANEKESTAKPAKSRKSAKPKSDK